MTNTGKSEGPGAEISPWLDQMEQKSNLSRSQILIWLGQAVERKAPLYNSAFAWRLTGDLDIDRFTVAFNQLVIDCDALRTVFEERDSIPVQYQLDDVPRKLEVADLTDDPGGLRSGAEEA